jgi:hypothetical protein
MRLVRRIFIRSMPVTVVAAVVVMLAAPGALADGNSQQPAELVFAVQPTTTQVTSAMTPAVVVDVENSQGKVITNFDGLVTLTYAVNTIGAPLPSNNALDAVDGVATFPDLTFSAVGFGFELQASVEVATKEGTKEVTSAPSEPFNIVTQLVQCQPGQSCHTGTVSSNGTSGSAVASAASTTDVLTATGGGFPDLSCTTYGGVVSFTVTNRSKIITMTLEASIVSQAKKLFFDICWGSPTPFTTKNGSTSVFNPANGEYEGLLPLCRLGGPSPCIALQFRTLGGAVVSTVLAPAGDPHGTY